MDLDGVCFIRRGQRLIPADVHAEEWLETVKEGREVILTGRKTRNPRHHRWVFAVLKAVVDNSSRWRSTESLLDDLKFATGLYQKRLNMLTGDIQLVPGSISFASMDQDRFKAWFDVALEYLAGAIGTDPVTLLKESGVDDYGYR